MTSQLFGKERIVLISDSLCATGMLDGWDPYSGQEIEVRGNHATIAEETECFKKSLPRTVFRKTVRGKLSEITS